TEVNIDVILEERAKEFVAEGKRWFDLVRTDKLVERVRLHNPGGAPNIQDFHVLRPIPLTQIDRTSNDYPQNPGY
ncbi:MAG: RagB/SusD family nutrient uptake outer membrane protein, partial [Bacteroidota bacterium]